MDEDDLWHLTWVGGGVLGLSQDALEEKLDFLVDRFALSEGELSAMVKIQPTVLQLSKANVEATMDLLMNR